MKVRAYRNLFGETVTGDIGTASTQPYYQLYGEVHVETVPGSGTYYKTLPMALDPYVDVSARFILNAGFAGYFKAPHFNPESITAITKTTHNILKGKFYKGVVYGDPPVVQGTPTLVDDYLVLKGGFAKKYGFDTTWDHITTNQKFLSWHPDIKTVGMFQPEILHFLVQTAAVTTVNLKVKITYTDDTTETVTPRTLGSITQWDLLRIPAGIPNLGLASVNFAKTISFYELWLENQSSQKITESRFYELDQRLQPYERIWMYENSIGMPEIFRTLGKSVYKTGITPKYSQKAHIEGYDVKESNFLTHNTYLRAVQEVSTGFLRDRKTAEYMLDFLSQKATLYEIKNGSYWPMQLIAPSMHEEAVDEEYKYYVRFQVSGGFEDTVFTPNL